MDTDGAVQCPGGDTRQPVIAGSAWVRRYTPSATSALAHVQTGRR